MSSETVVARESCPSGLSKLHKLADGRQASRSATSSSSHPLLLSEEQAL